MTTTSTFCITLCTYNVGTSAADFLLRNDAPVFDEGSFSLVYAAAAKARLAGFLEAAETCDVLLLQEMHGIDDEHEVHSTLIKSLEDLGFALFRAPEVRRGDGSVARSDCVVALSSSAFDLSGQSCQNLSLDVPELRRDYAMVLAKHVASLETFLFVSGHLSGYKMDGIRIKAMNEQQRQRFSEEHLGGSSLNVMTDEQIATAQEPTLTELKWLVNDMEERYDGFPILIGMDSNSDRFTNPKLFKILESDARFLVVSPESYHTDENSSNKIVKQSTMDLIAFGNPDSLQTFGSLPEFRVLELSELNGLFDWDFLSATHNSSDHHPVFSRLTWRSSPPENPFWRALRFASSLLG